MNGSASIHSGASTIDMPFRVKNTQGGNCGTRSATNCTETETRKVDRTGAYNCRTRMFMASSFSREAVHLRDVRFRSPRDVRLDDLYDPFAHNGPRHAITSMRSR